MIMNASMPINNNVTKYVHYILSRNTASIKQSSTCTDNQENNSGAVEHMPLVQIPTIHCQPNAHHSETVCPGRVRVMLTGCPAVSDYPWLSLLLQAMQLPMAWGPRPAWHTKAWHAQPGTRQHTGTLQVEGEGRQGRKGLLDPHLYIFIRFVFGMSCFSSDSEREREKWERLGEAEIGEGSGYYLRLDSNPGPQVHGAAPKPTCLHKGTPPAWHTNSAARQDDREDDREGGRSYWTSIPTFIEVSCRVG